MADGKKIELTVKSKKLERTVKFYRAGDDFKEKTPEHGQRRVGDGGGGGWGGGGGVCGGGGGGGPTDGFPRRAVHGSLKAG